MIPALIDLHVRPLLNEEGCQDIELLAIQARDHGLDGVVVVGRDVAVELGDTVAVTEATGVRLFSGVEVESDLGPLLCFPRQIDAWFREGNWRSVAHELAEGQPVYRASALAQAFAERGGAVIGAARAPDDSDAGRSGAEEAAQAGLSAMVVTGTPAQAMLDDRAVTAAHAARLACVGGSASSPGEERFGAVATLFASPPMTQENLCEGLRSGRVWPVEIGAAVQQRAVVQAPARKPERPVRGEAPIVQVEGEEEPRGEDGQVRQAKGERTREPKPARPEKPRAKVDPFERPGDNRGNRLNREEVRRLVTTVITTDDVQPSIDPVAVMYGLENRRVMRNSNKSDAEIDRINGNRSRGPDPNVMVIPQFDELRAERQHVSLLFCQPDEDRSLEDSIALRFALAHYKHAPASLAAVPSARDNQRRGRPANKRRR